MTNKVSGKIGNSSKKGVKPVEKGADAAERRARSRFSLQLVFRYCVRWQVQQECIDPLTGLRVAVFKQFKSVMDAALHIPVYIVRPAPNVQPVVGSEFNKVQDFSV